MPRRRARHRGWLRSLTHGVAAWLVLSGAVVGLSGLRALADAKHLIQEPDPTIPRVQLSATTITSWKTFPSYSNAIPVLMYHAVGAHGKTPATIHLNVSRRMFAMQMRALYVGGFHAITLRQYVDWYNSWRAGKGSTVSLPTKPILITFDDGRVDAYRAAAAILRHYHFHAADLVVPGWVASHPRFELQWNTMRRMEQVKTFTIQEHFGFGTEGVPVNAKGEMAGRFGHPQYFPGSHGRPGHVESLQQFFRAFHYNMEWGEQQLKNEVPGFQHLAMALPESDYGQAVPSDPEISGHVLGWLNAHYTVVFDGDYLYGGDGGSLASARLTKQVVYRIKMESQLSLGGLRCRLYDFVTHAPIWMEYRCKRMRT